VCVNELKYLCMMFCDGRMFSVPNVGVCNKFYIAVNSVISQCKYASGPVKLKLFLIIVFTVFDIWHGGYHVLRQSRVHALNVCWTDVYRKFVWLH